jgi:PhnB protein
VTADFLILSGQGEYRKWRAAGASRRAVAAVEFYVAAFGARVVHCVGEGDEIVAQLAVGEAAFWVSPGGAAGPRFSPLAIGGATGRILLVVDDPDELVARAVRAGARALSQVRDEHGWRVGG